MADESEIERILAANRYLVLATTGGAGDPWATPVFFAPLRSEGGSVDRLCWVSSPESDGEVLAALDARLPAAKRLDADDLHPGVLAAYAARIRRRYVLVRGGDPEYGNEIDTTMEVR
ncbi:hypothetical protein P5G50_07805 [Leifsonia sp. F6_8S_P_1B]|uniref:Pyridoxamine 5'-phosphate oxidase putative domain-containing protein n=1 Tax=Leifsonia williamsii TaxID=3035919 RepID=A0ABT8KA88_9MICO|nr:hypothetical protein [Leifsonia williamsii]MDN4614351.1 hypothetical protein [Leifsonia williamsii]